MASEAFIYDSLAQISVRIGHSFKISCKERTSRDSRKECAYKDFTIRSPDKKGKVLSCIAHRCVSYQMIEKLGSDVSKQQ